MATDTDADTTNWYGSFEDDWTNKETGERIEFRTNRPNHAIEVWICNGNSDNPRGSRLATASTRSEAIEKAHEFATKYNTTSKWGFLEQ